MSFIEAEVFMNKYALSFTAFLTGCVLPALAAEYSPEAVEQKGELFYLKETGKPLTGTVIRTIQGGKLQSAFENGVLNGESRGFYENGQTHHIITFKNNLKDGVFKQFDENGHLLIQAVYQNNRLNGELITYYPNGQPSAKEIYKDDMLNGPKTTYYETGQLKSTVSYANNQHEGLAQTYYEDGTLQSEFHFHNNQREGVSKIYYPNGKVQFEMNYLHDKLNGENKNYQNDGTPAQKRIYQNGLVTSGVIYQNQKEEKLTPAQIDELNSKTVIHTQKNTVEKNGVRLDSTTRKPISGIYFDVNDKGFAVKEMQYLNGKPDGIMRTFDANGSVTEQAVYENGIKKSFQQLDSTGKVLKSCQIENGKEICQ